MEVNCETIAVIAATFANGGVCPLTREPVIAPEVCRDVLSLLHSCGFYEYSGNFAFKVSQSVSQSYFIITVSLCKLSFLKLEQKSVTTATFLL